MNLFSPAAAPAPAGGGQEILRQAVRSRKMGLAGIGRELGIAIHALESFLAGGTLPATQLDAIAALVFGTGVTLNWKPTCCSTRRDLKPKPFATVTPPQFERVPLSDIVRSRPVPKSETPLQPAWPRQPGWADIRPSPAPTTGRRGRC